MVRDNALAVSHLHQQEHRRRQRVPYQPPGIWEELSRGETFTAQEYHESAGPDLYRRSMYTFWKRTVPPAALNTFDAPDREKCTSRRLITNTPLQALVLLNDPTYVEACARPGPTRAPGSARRCRRARAAFYSARPRRGAPRRPNCACSLELAQREIDHYKKIRQPAAKLISIGRVEGRQRGSRGTGGMDHGGQHHPQSGRDHHQGIKYGHHQAPFLLAQQHRHRDRRAGFAAGAGRLRRGGNQRNRRPAGTAAFRAQSQARGLPAPIGRAFADGPVRLQADARQTRPGTELPGSVRMGQRITGMTSGQSAFPVARSIFKFEQHGESGAWVSELLPHTAKIVDELAIIKTMNTDAINHDPAITFIQSGSQQPGRPSMGAWVSYGSGQREPQSAGVRRDALAGAGAEPGPAALLAPLGQRLSALQSPGRALPRGQQSGALPAQSGRHRPGHAPRHARRRGQAQSHAPRSSSAIPEIETRISQYEMAFRMQTSVPDLLDLSKEPQSTFDLYGPDARKPGTYAANCLLARRLLERDVRFVQLYHRGWDQHNDLPRDLALQCKGTDQASAALVTDLKQRGLLGRHAGGMGRRIRPHRVLPGTA